MQDVQTRQALHSVVVNMPDKLMDYVWTHSRVMVVLPTICKRGDSIWLPKRPSLDGIGKNEDQQNAPENQAEAKSKSFKQRSTLRILKKPPDDTEQVY